MPVTGVDLIIDEGVDVRIVGEDASAALDTAVDNMVALLDSHWDLVDNVWRTTSTSQVNRRKTDLACVDGTTV